MTQTDDVGTAGWGELLGPKNLGAATVLAGGVALYATNEFLTVTTQELYFGKKRAD